MIIYLFNPQIMNKFIIFLSIFFLPLSASAETVAKEVPSGGVITFISISVVFISLLILYFFYSLAGKLFTGQLKPSCKCSKSKVSKTNAKEEEVALAIAMALDKEMNGEVNAAIALAMHNYLNDCVHDQESFVLTIRPRESAWASKQSTLRTSPTRK